SLRAARVAGLPLAAGLAGLADCTCVRAAALRGAGLLEGDLLEPVLLEAFWLDAALLGVFLLAALVDADWPGAAFVDALRAPPPEGLASGALSAARTDFDAPDCAFAARRAPSRGAAGAAGIGPPSTASRNRRSARSSSTISRCAASTSVRVGMPSVEHICSTGRCMPARRRICASTIRPYTWRNSCDRAIAA